MSYSSDVYLDSNRTVEYDTEKAVAYELGHNVGNDTKCVEPFDLLSFLSVIATCDAHDNTSAVLLSICFGPWSMLFPITPYRGTFFSVTLVTSRNLLRRTPAGQVSCHLPKLVALKTPHIEEKFYSPQNSRSFRTIAKEYQILKSRSLSTHENIIKLFGCCWQTVDAGNGLPVPSLVLEGTALGDLERFSTTQEMTLRKRLGICIDIALGLQAIHALGIVHGDLKPQNILIFRSKTRAYIAKIADFGNSIFLDETSVGPQLPIGTALYSAPECFENRARLNREELIKTDIFSLGIVLIALVFGMYIIDEMKKILPASLVALKKTGSFEKWITELSSQQLRAAESQLQSDSIDDKNAWETVTGWTENEILGDESLWTISLSLVKYTLAAISVERFSSVEDGVLPVLRKLLRLHLRRLLEGRDSSRHADSLSTTATPEWWAKMSKILRRSKSEIRKLSGAQIKTSHLLNQQEKEAVTLSYVDGSEAHNLLRESQFIHKYSRNKRVQARPAVNHRLGMSLSRGMLRILTEWIRHKLTKWTDLKPFGLDKKIFKISQHASLFGTLPSRVKEMLEAQLKHEAIIESNTKTEQADAAYEYAHIIFWTAELKLKTFQVVEALELLAQSAEKGHVKAQSTVGSLYNGLGYSLPIRHELEIEWLFAGTLIGGMTAQKRLKDLDREKHEAAMTLMRSSYGQFDPEIFELLHEQNMHDMLSADPLLFAVSSIHYLTSIGDIESLSKLSRMPREMFDHRNNLGETPLVIACRSGNAEVAMLLLERGSDPSINTNQGVSPLHFLAAFNDQMIPTMTNLLLQRGAVLEQPCRQGMVYKSRFDSRFGTVDGTPLLWAVAARNACATKELVERGANPFKTAMDQLPNYGRYDLWEPSPIIWAAMWHQHQLIKILLSGAKTPQERLVLQHRLNTTFYRYNDVYYSTLFVALDCNPLIRFHELLLHGSNYESAVLKCVQLLIDYGSDPKILSQDWNDHSDDPIVAACHGGNMLVIKYLWQYMDGSLRPTSEKWLSAVQGAIFSHSRSVFDFLFEHREEIASDDVANEAAIKEILLSTEDQYFALASLKLVLKPMQSFPSTKLCMLFKLAIIAGHFEVAKQLFQDGGFSLTSRIGGNTFLGELISMSHTHPNVDRKILFFLSIMPQMNELFWNVSYLERSGLSALQAVVCAQDRRCRMNAGVFNAIHSHFDEPRLLNAQVKAKPGWRYTGYTALHLAVERNNPDAVLILRNKSGINVNLLNSTGVSPTDLCVIRDRSLSEAQGLTSPTSNISIRKDKETNIMVLYNLLSVGGHISMFCAVIRRCSESTFDIIHRGRGLIPGVQLCGKIETLAPAVSQSSRSLVLLIPIGDMIQFVDTSSDTYMRLPVDIERLILSV